MYIEQLYTSCLAEAAYYVESEGEAIIIDPLRDIDAYLNLANERGSKIKYIFETHFHADFVSGHIDLAKKTGASIVYGPNAEPNYDVIIAKDSEEFMVGKLKIKVLHTPGHTLESSCYLLFDENGKEYSIFTGDTLFVGDVGRPDLAVKSDLTQDQLAGLLYHSLHNKVLTLPDEVIVYPAHGPGSQCGKNLGSETTSTIGEQRETNYALQKMTEADFVKSVTDGLLPPPKYFFKDAMINKMGYDNIDEVMAKNVIGLSIDEFQKKMNDGTLILDTRHPEEFAKMHIPGSINIGIDGSYAVWVGTVLDFEKDILVVADKGREEEAILRLARVGYEKVLGYLNATIEEWKANNQPIDHIPSILPTDFNSIQNTRSDFTIVDVRKPSEYEAERLSNSKLVPLSDLLEHLDEMDKDENYYVHCAGGYRSMIASSLMKRAGFKHVNNISGGMSKMREVMTTV